MVCRLFNEIGLVANTEVPITTPRGNTTVDVFAVDEASVDKIEYIVECKNWNSAIPQTVVHAFTAVMHETGANIGFIVSKVGLQSGAVMYTECTNISGLTYLELQARYFRPWWYRHFCTHAAAAAEYVNQYVEPFNTHRDRCLKRLKEPELAAFSALRDRYASFGMMMWLMDIGNLAPQYRGEPPCCIDGFKDILASTIGDQSCFDAKFYRELLTQVCAKLLHIEKQFNRLFGGNIFDLEGSGRS